MIITYCGIVPLPGKGILNHVDVKSWIPQKDWPMGREEMMLYPLVPFLFFRSTPLLWTLLLGIFCKAESNSIIDFSLSSANTFFVRSASKVSVRSKLAFHPLETQLVFSSSLTAFISWKHFSCVGGSSDSPCIINISASPTDSIRHTLYSIVTKWHYSVEYT